jgi:hypothetical protein
MINNVEAAEAAHNALSDTDEEYGRASAYVKMAPHYIKLIKSKQLLKVDSGTVAEKEALAFSSIEYKDYLDNLDTTMVKFEILEAKRESWQREVEIWRTISANQRR